MFARLVNSEPDPGRLSSVRVWLSASDNLTLPKLASAFGSLERSSVCPVATAFRPCSLTATEWSNSAASP